LIHSVALLLEYRVTTFLSSAVTEDIPLSSSSLRVAVLILCIIVISLFVIFHFLVILVVVLPQEGIATITGVVGIFWIHSAHMPNSTPRHLSANHKVHRCYNESRGS
jgi:hypothetical protein